MILKHFYLKKVFLGGSDATSFPKFHKKQLLMKFWKRLVFSTYLVTGNFTIRQPLGAIQPAAEELLEK